MPGKASMLLTVPVTTGSVVLAVLSITSSWSSNVVPYLA